MNQSACVDCQKPIDKDQTMDHNHTDRCCACYDKMITGLRHSELEKRMNNRQIENDYIRR